MNLKKVLKPVLTIVIVFVTLNVYSQQNFQPGYIINLKGDTLHGFIDYRNWGVNPVKVSFKQDLGSGSEIYTPTDIKEFAVSNEIYYSAIVEVDPKLYSMGNLDYLYDTPNRTDTTFLRTLVKGDKSLYLYKDKNWKDHFFIKNDNQFDLLKYKTYYNEKREKIVDSRYKGQLILYFNNDPKIVSELKDLRYEQRDLERLFEKYYGKSIRSKDKIKTKYGALAGLSLSTLKFGNDVRRELIDVDFSASKNITFGLFFNIIFPRNHGKLSLNSEFLYNSYMFKEQRVSTMYFPREDINYLNIGYTYLRANVLLRFKFPVRSSFIYINSGLSNNFIVDEKNYMDVESTSPEYNHRETLYNVSGIYEQGFLFGLGFKYKKVSFETRYVTLNSATKQYCFLLGYDFN